MASASRSLCRVLLETSRATPAKRKCLVQYQRSFSVATSRCDKPEPKIPESVYFRDIERTLATIKQKGASNRPSREEADQLRKLYEPEPSEYMTPESPLTVNDLTRDERADYESLSATEKDDYLPRLNHFKAVSEYDGHQLNEDMQDKAIAYMNRARPLELEPRLATHAKTGMGLWAEDEDDELGQTPDNDDDIDPSAITSVAESELQLHREIRQYTRVAAWEMPLLTKLAIKEFDPPTLKTPLRFRYTTYMGETHPASSKVVLEFTSHDLSASLSLTPAQTIKLTKLLGPRYNAPNDTARLSCERFEHAAQNKRYLGDLLGSLIREAKEGEDLFEDLPRDERHARKKERVWFPKEWLLSEGRVKALAEERKAAGSPQGGPRAERDLEAQGRIAEYMAKMPLGRREGPSAGAGAAGGSGSIPQVGEEAERVPEREPVRVR